MTEISLGRNPRPRLILAGMFGVYLGLAIHSLWGKSVTIDEQGHLPVGYNVLTTGDFGYCELNPPLMNVIHALPLLFLDIRHTLGEPPIFPYPGYRFWSNGKHFMLEQKERYREIYLAARITGVVGVGLLGLVLFLWASELVPSRSRLAGLLAAGFAWFSPNFLAHARLVTTDAGIALFFTLALWALHRFLKRPDWSRAFFLGVALGLAQLIKFTAVLLYPLALSAVIALALTGRERCPRRDLFARLSAALLISWLVLNLGYLFQDFGRPIGTDEFNSGGLAYVRRILPSSFPVFLPDAFVKAFDRQSRDVSVGDPSYLLGETFHGGVWYYFLVLLAVKTPLPMLLLGLLALWVQVTGKGLSTRQGVFLLVPAVAIAAVFSLLSNKQIGLRMILPAYPMCWLWVACCLVQAPWSRAARGVILALACWSCVETLRIHPDYLAYFNPLAGGPARGSEWAVDSNLDWGQDLPKLKAYMEEQGLETIQLLYFGSTDPEIHGIRYTVPKAGVRPGLLAVSVSLLHLPWTVYDHGTYERVGPYRLDREVFGDPVAVLGHTIRIYRVKG